MDFGVGFFIFSGGFFAGARLGLKRTKKERFQHIIKSVKISIPVVVLGLIRMFVTKGINYQVITVPLFFLADLFEQEHATEYGIHWNFFFTLGLIPVFTSILQFILPFLNFGVLSALVIMGKTITYLAKSIIIYCLVYQRVLMSGLQDFILNAPRDLSLIHMNREGICSFFGMVFKYYLIGIFMKTNRFLVYIFRGLPYGI